LALLYVLVYVPLSPSSKRHILAAAATSQSHDYHLTKTDLPTYSVQGHCGPTLVVAGSLCKRCRWIFHALCRHLGNSGGPFKRFVELQLQLFLPPQAHPILLHNAACLLQGATLHTSRRMPAPTKNKLRAGRRHNWGVCSRLCQSHRPTTYSVRTKHIALFVGNTTLKGRAPPG
jgi:hypothetical protein